MQRTLRLRRAAAVQTGGYQGFGSFMSPDVEVLIRQPAHEYREPACLRVEPPWAGPAPAFGRPLREALFSLDPAWAFLNHGAFGAVARPVARAADAWRAHVERQPLRGMDRDVLPLVVAATRRLAAFAGARAAEELVFVPNATAGLNVVLAHEVGRLGPGDEVFALDVGYGAVKAALEWLCARSGARLVLGELPLPVRGADDVLAAVDRGVGPRTRLAVLDHVTSNTALRLPVEAAARLCADRGARVVVDGAHGLVANEVSLARLAAAGVQAYVGNLHKWVCGARGSAFVWVGDEAARAEMQPLVRSHGASRGFVSRFAWDGARDYAPVAAVPTALALWDALGQAAAREYSAALQREAVEFLERRWGTSRFAPLDMCAPVMALVQLPVPGDRDPADEQNRLYAQGVEVPVKALGGRLYVRVSTFVHGDMEGVERLCGLF